MVDNSGTHILPNVTSLLAKNPRITMHFTPTSASWLNMVERFFAEITRNRIRRGAFKSVAELKSAMLGTAPTGSTLGADERAAAAEADEVLDGSARVAEELDAMGRARARSERDAEAERRLAELKRRMGK